jgi:hypothetical protein
MSAAESIAELYAQVYATPADDHVRRVLADALIAANDPRGELILWQLEPDKDYHRRAMRLIQQHGVSWLGPLRGMVIPLAYERGFLASCQLVSEVEIDFTLEMWATVHTIDASELAHHERIEITPVMRSLRKVFGLRTVHAARLTAADKSVGARIRLVMHGEPVSNGPTEPYDPVAE